MVYWYMMLPSKIEISHKTIIFITILILGIWVVFQIRDILLHIFIAVILMSTLRPLVDSLERVKVPRIIAILIIYLVAIGLISLGLGSTIPQLVSQTTRLMNDLPMVVGRLLPFLNLDIQSITQQLAPLGENLFRVTVSIFSNIFTLVTILSFNFYFLLERKHSSAFLNSTFGEENGRKILSLVEEIENRLGAWARGEILLMFLVGFMVYIGLSILRLDFALPLAIFAGLLEIVPMIGPIISAIPAVLVGLAVSPPLALTVVALYIVVQQVENNVFIPVVMKRSVGLSPLVTIFALLIGARFAGIIGAFLSVPLVLVCQVLINYFLVQNSAVKK